MFAGLLLGPAVGLATVGTLLPSIRRSVLVSWQETSGRQITGAAVRGLAIGALTLIALRVLLPHHYEVGLGLQRAILLAVFAVAAIPAFCSLEVWLCWLAPGGSRWPAGCLTVLAVLTVVLASRLFTRMSMAPGYLLAAVLLMSTAHRVGNPTRGALAATVFAALVTGWMAAVVCALY